MSKRGKGTPGVNIVGGRVSVYIDGRDNLEAISDVLCSGMCKSRHPREEVTLEMNKVDQDILDPCLRLRSRRHLVTYRVGIGHDTHRLGSGGPLVLGGLQLDHDQHAIGHSDADVLLHAITDAVLGAASLGDIGELFPDTNSANKGKDSAEMLQAAVALAQQAGFKTVNLDCIVFAQRPKLSRHKLPIRDRIAELLDIKPELVGVKAKTGESVGPIGREEAISAQCVVLLDEIV